MNEQIEKLKELLAQNPEIQKQVKENPPKSKEEILAILAQLGFDVDEATIGQELSPEELEKVSAGTLSEAWGDGGFEGFFMSVACVCTIGVAIYA